MSRNPEEITEALRRYLPGGDAIRAVVPLTTGFSNETYRIEGTDWILRMPPVGGAIVWLFRRDRQLHTALGFRTNELTRITPGELTAIEGRLTVDQS